MCEVCDKSNIHDVCNLKAELAALRQKSQDDDKALILADKIASTDQTAKAAKWLGYIAVLGMLINIAIAFWKH